MAGKSPANLGALSGDKGERQAEREARAKCLGDAALRCRKSDPGARVVQISTKLRQSRPVPTHRTDSILMARAMHKTWNFNDGEDDLNFSGQPELRPHFPREIV